MYLLSTSPDIIEIQGLKNILDIERIESKIINENLIQLAGELPYAHCWPQLLVFSEADLKRAKEIIEAYNKEEVEGEDWTCECGEVHAYHFSECWNCAATDKAF